MTMGRRGSCSVCNHPNRAAFDTALKSGETVVSACERLGIPRRSAYRHMSCVKDSSIRHERQAVLLRLSQLELVERLHQMTDRAQEILDDAREAEDGFLALRALAELRAQTELEAEFQGKISRSVQLVIAPEWLQLRTLLLTALADYPEAKRAVALALGVEEEPRALLAPG